LPDRPEIHFGGTPDVLGDVITSLRLTMFLFARIELGSPWGLSREAGPLVSLYIIGRGGAELVVGEQTWVLAAGDVALLPNGCAHILRDGKDAPLHRIGTVDCRPVEGRQPYLGGDGARSTIVAGAFRVGSAVRSPFFESLPPVLHVAAGDPRASPWLPSTVQLLLAESASQSPGGSMVLSRLVDILFVQALRTMMVTEKAHLLCALSDPQIGTALAKIHETPSAPWTVATLASAVGMSRSSFAERFHELVGQPALAYVSRWRMTLAGGLLQDADLPVMGVASQVGYASEAAFNRAFKRWAGTTPAAFRRQRGAERVHPQL
jgi:AraC-like DNA-binding protein